MKTITAYINNQLYKSDMKTYCYFGGIVLVCLYYLPFLIFGQNGYLIIHDNLDQNMDEFITLKFLHAPYFQDGRLIQVMNGLPENMFMASKYCITGLLFLIFHPFTAYLLNDFLSRIVGFVGMALLLDHCLLKRDFQYRNVVIFSVAIFFALLGCYTCTHGLSILGQPLVMFAFYNLYKGEAKWRYYLLIAIFAFWSSLQYIGIFIGVLLVSIWLRGLIIDRRLRLPYLYGMILLGIGYLISAHSLILSQFDKSVIPHRVEYKQEPFSFLSQLISTVRNGGLITAYHTGQFWTIFILAPLIYLIFKRKLTRFTWYIIGGIALILMFQFLYPYMVMWVGEAVPLLKTLNLTRFNWLLPMFWLTLFALTVEMLLNSALKQRLVFSIILTAGLCFSVTSHNRELRWNMGRLARITPQIPSFRDFYDTGLFGQIKKHIDKPEETYRVVSLGLYPSIASYNGFFCLDGYLCLYPLQYKHQFREIIAKELDKDAMLKSYFDDWGSRCYLFSAELRSKDLWSKEDNKKVFNLDINTEKLRQLSQKETYILAAVEIMNHKDLGLTQEKVFEGYYWKIYLYRVN